ncbi:hypothetical protein Anas_10372 [Armadillidium nasatum]|uniref:Uncharacterized protein n=1 Tax=Armadillidium nasatum TaxID=96803 RepID=A0A5N5SSP8_9CRUS|nr:hypothetical protein Anas_10372 [Armadillidium nasatum]
MLFMCVLGVGSGVYIWKPIFSEMSEVKKKQSKEES